MDGKGGIISSLNSRLFLVKRLRKCVNNVALRKIADSLFNSKIRYGLQLLGKVRLTDSDETQSWLKKTQLMQNKLTRFLNGTQIKDKISTKSILTKLNMLSVNQMNAQMKLTEAWKVNNEPEYPIKWVMKSTQDDERLTRATAADIVPETARTNLSQSTFNNDAKKIWNLAPLHIKNCTSIFGAKKAIKNFVATLPI